MSKLEPLDLSRNRRLQGVDRACGTPVPPLGGGVKLKRVEYPEIGHPKIQWDSKGPSWSIQFLIIIFSFPNST